MGNWSLKRRYHVWQGMEEDNRHDSLPDVLVMSTSDAVDRTAAYTHLLKPGRVGLSHHHSSGLSQLF